MLEGESDEPVVAMKRGNARGAKGLWCTYANINTPGGTPAWLKATITQDGLNAVLIKMDAISLLTTPTVEAVQDWAFNIHPDLDLLTSSLSATEVSSARVGSTGEFPIPVPEPSTYAAGALLMIPVLVQIRRKLRSNQA